MVRTFFRRNILLVTFLSCCASPGFAYDTLRLSLNQADSIFLQRNLLLLSQLYNVSIQDALVIQAKAYPNPVIGASVNAIDPENDRFFNIGQQGQKEFDIEQILLLGGKRKSTISMARQTKSIAESELADVLRNLKLQLHSSFYQLNKYRLILASYDRQLGLLGVIMQAYEQQAAKGNIPVKDVIRLKTVYLRISNNRLELVALQWEEIKKLQLLMHMPAYPVPQIDDIIFDEFQRPRELAGLLEIAMSNRPDLQIAEKQVALSKTNVQLQKQLAIPDVLLNAGYDQRGGAFQNQVNVGLAVPLPLFNRNRGNIKAASYVQLSSEALFNQKQSEVQAEVESAWHNLGNGITEYAKASQLYTKDFDDVFNGVNDNFVKRNISLLEFVDFFEAYNESLSDFQRIKAQLALLAEQINYVTASHVY
ncbi:MAG: TolC family protein [Cytophagales bacterium]|nr:TolC family protein [Cytophagales bacterium]